MCGRSACSLSKESIIRANVYKCAKTNQLLTPEWIPLNTKQLDSYKQNFNQSPGQSLPVLLLKKQIDKNCDNNKELRIISEMRWGLVPNWFKSDINQFKLKTINCRLESIKEKKTYSVPLLKGKRCVVLVEGFFEWKTLKDGSKEPYFFYFPQKYVDFKHRNWMKDENHWFEDNEWRGPRLLTIAGLFETRKSLESDETLFSFTIITVPSHPKYEWIHSRMPAILESEEDVRKWLDFENVSADEAIKLLVPFDKLEWHSVTKAVGNVRNNTIENILPLKELPKNETKKQKTIVDFFKSKSTPKISTKNSQMEQEVKKEVKDYEDFEEIKPKRQRKEI